MVNVNMLIWGALGERFKSNAPKRPTARGPHEVGGAEPEAQRLSSLTLLSLGYR
jgi:hypothetical protein